MPQVFDGPLDIQAGGPPTPEKMRAVADWLDLADNAFAVLADIQGAEVALGSEVQEDLRRWADEMDIDTADAILDGTARVCHEANRALQHVQADPAIGVSPPWDHSSEEQRNSVRQGVLNALDGVDPEESHTNWMDFKFDRGWTYGEVKNEATKEHPLLVPYADLPESAKVKDRLFVAIVEALMGS